MTFQVKEATIDSIHFAMKNREVTCRELVGKYLERIESYDKKGPEINSIITLNSKAIEEADALDQYFEQTGKFKGPLHGIPILVKDQVETEGITTTFGSEAFKNYIPKEDATAIQLLRKAGAIIIAKTLLPDFATSWFAFSSSGGETKNPYDLNRDPGGSSSGSAAGVAANFGTVAIGEDTGGSIRLPASFNNVFGVRVTTGLISRNGMSPLVHFQDTAGPMTRSVKDAAILLDTLVGYDSTDPFTAASLYAKDAGNYANGLNNNVIKGTRVGILREAFGSEDNPESAQVNEVVNKAIASMEEAGVTVIDPITIPDLQKYNEETALYLTQSKHDIDNFIKQKSDQTIDSIFQTNQYHPLLDLFKGIVGGPVNPEEDPNYYKQLNAQERFKREIENVMAKHDLDAIVFPDVQILPPTKKELHEEKWTVLTFPTNTLISSQTGLPSISMPGGFTKEGLPVGVQILGKSFDEATLLRIAYSYEQHAKPRKAPHFEEQTVK
ncbi:amidase [Bacillus hwajinpoensis]|uniref:Amidase n=1 Tax=Guptibacillus hwajinpoensis TaxID=208199 RepID=A0A845F093_9BACL|nr:amidase [Pseudalkalibacillus hwajinpoensis]MYL64164.1 amidase [Pseudalkalibacillus hwajinpoensis]